MKKKISLAAVVLLTVSLASAQTKKEKVPPPPPPAPPVLKMAPPPPPPPPKVSRKKLAPPKVWVEHFPSSNNEEYQTFLKNNPTVKSIGWTNNRGVHIYLKSGKDEVYDLNNREQVQNLESKYGKLPVAPPPPPKPLPPPPPKGIKEEV